MFCCRFAFYIFFRITDAQNETKDKVKYLEALRRHLEQLHAETKPIAIVNVVLPTLIGAIKQMDAISRFYARTGYLGLLCMKVIVKKLKTNDSV